MALDRAIDSAQLDADLTAVADAIRAKGGTSGALAFPDGFVEAVGAIQAGAGAFGMSDSDFLQAAKTIEQYENNEITKFIDMPSPFGAFKTKYLRFNNLTQLGGSKFAWHSSLVEAYFPSLTTISNFTMRYCSNLEILDYGSSGIANYDLDGCNSLRILILRKTSGTQSLGGASINFPSGSPMGDGTGTVYVPQALIESYQTATNWSYLYGINPDVFQPLEGSEYE